MEHVVGRGSEGVLGARESVCDGMRLLSSCQIVFILDKEFQWTLWEVKMEGGKKAKLKEVGREDKNKNKNKKDKK